MKLYNTDLLATGNYKFIKVNNNSQKNIIRVKLNDKKEEIIEDITITNTIKCFLKNKIRQVSFVNIDNSQIFINITSVDGKVLNMYLINNALSKNIINKIYSKYYFDRIECINNCSKFKIVEGSSMSSYAFNNEIIELNFCNNRILGTIELDFLKQFIYEKLYNENGLAYLNLYSTMDGFCLICNDLKIDILNPELYDWVEKLVNKYNNRKKEKRKLNE